MEVFTVSIAVDIADRAVFHIEASPDNAAEENEPHNDPDGQERLVTRFLAFLYKGTFRHGRTMLRRAPTIKSVTCDEFNLLNLNSNILLF